MTQYPYVIEITSTPLGQNPLWVRRAWVGLQIPANDPTPVTVPTASVADQATARHDTGYVVKLRDAVGLLSLQDENAARWWIDRVPSLMTGTQTLMFHTSCCRALW